MSAQARRNSPGFFPSDRAKLRRARAGVDGQVVMVVHMLATEANAEGVIRVGTLNDLAEDLNVQPKWLKVRLETAERAGLIEWQRAANQYDDGHVRILCDFRWSTQDAPTGAAPQRGGAQDAATVPRPVPRAVPLPVAHPYGVEHSGETPPNSGQWIVESGQRVTPSSNTYGGEPVVGEEEVIIEAANELRADRTVPGRWANTAEEQRAVRTALDEGWMPFQIVGVLALDGWITTRVTEAALRTRLAHDGKAVVCHCCRGHGSADGCPCCAMRATAAGRAPPDAPCPLCDGNWWISDEQGGGAVMCECHPRRRETG